MDIKPSKGDFGDSSNNSPINLKTEPEEASPIPEKREETSLSNSQK